jgi:hypothetical protein
MARAQRLGSTIAKLYGQKGLTATLVSHMITQQTKYIRSYKATHYLRQEIQNDKQYRKGNYERCSHRSYHSSQMVSMATGEKQMSTEETQALALKTLHEAIQALKDCGLMTEEEEEDE